MEQSIGKFPRTSFFAGSLHCIVSVVVLLRLCPAYEPLLISSKDLADFMTWSKGKEIDRFVIARRGGTARLRRWGRRRDAFRKVV